MPTVFEPLYDAKFIEPIVTNLQAYLRDNELAAFTAQGFPDLAETQVWRISRWYNTLFPVVSVIPLKTVPAEAEDRGRLDEDHNIEIEIEIDGSDADVLAREGMRRIASYDALLRKISREQLLGGLNLDVSGAHSMDIGEHNYSYFAKDVTLYKVVVNMLLTIHVIEGRAKAT
jgi:hypothetical protein